MESMSATKENKGKIVLIRGGSAYNVLGLACDLMAKGFEENGYNSVVIDATKYTDPSVLFEVINNEMANNGLFVFSYNALLHNLVLTNQVSVYDELGYPVLGFLVDHPYYHKSRVETSQRDNIHIGCIDPDHVKYIHSYYPNLKNVAFLPHFSFQGENIIPYDDRKVDLYYPGSYQDPDVYKYNFAELPDVFRDTALKIYEMILLDTTLTVEEALKSYLSLIQLTYSPKEFVEIMDQMFFVDHAVRDYRRDKIVRTILEAGMEITVSGKGWKHLEQIYHNKIHILGAEGLDIEENIKLIADTKILFNTFPNFKNGTHERIFTAMRNGCVCLTDPSGYLLENFENNENLVYYSIDKINELPGIIKDLLDHPERAAKIAENGYSKANVEYNEKNTAKRVLAFMGLK